MTDRQQQHARALAITAKALDLAGYHVDRVKLGRHQYVFADGQLIAVRGASEAMRPHVVTVRGQRYDYVYRTILWNLIPVGDEARAEMWAFVALRETGPAVMLVPADRLRREDGSLPPTLKIAAAGVDRHWIWSHRLQPKKAIRRAA